MYDPYMALPGWTCGEMCDYNFSYLLEKYLRIVKIVNMEKFGDIFAKIHRKHKKKKFETLFAKTYGRCEYSKFEGLFARITKKM